MNNEVYDKEITSELMDLLFEVLILIKKRFHYTLLIQTFWSVGIMIYS